MVIKISLAQTRIVFGDVSKNLDVGRILINQASEFGSDLIIFPELWTSGFDYKNIDEIAKRNNDAIAELSVISSKNNIAIAGSYILKDREKFHNGLIFIEPGKHHRSYRKIHLFKMLREDQYFRPGKTIRIIRTLGMNIGLTICYDLRFPELFRLYMNHSVDLVINSAEWPRRRITHWKSLTTVRAIENQFYMACCNSVGSTGGVNYGGDSCIIDPWGKKSFPLSLKENVLLTGEIDTELVKKVRHEFPVLSDIRKDIYG